MGNALEFILKLQDMLTPAMRQAARVSDSASAQIQSQFSAIQGSGKRMSASVDELRARLDGVNKVRFSSTIQREFDIATSAARRLENQIEKLENQGAGSSSKGGILGSIIGGNLISGGISKIGSMLASGASGIVQAAAQQEQNKVGLKTFLGEKGASDAYENIKKDAAVTPFDTQSLLMVNRSLISAGLNAKDARRDTLNLANAVSAVGGSNDELSRMATNMQQIKTVGKASALDIKQFGYAGINIYQLLANATGKTIDQVKNMDVSYALLSKSLQQAAEKGGMYYGALDAQGKTLSGKWSTFMDNIKNSAADIGSALQPAFHWLLDIGIGITNNLSMIMPYVQPVIDGLNNIPNIISSLLSPTSQWAGYISVIKEYGLYLWQTLKHVAANVWNIVSGVWSWMTKSQMIQDLFWALGKLGQGILWVIGKVSDVLVWTWSNVLKPILNAIEWVYEKIKSILGLGGGKPIEIKGTANGQIIATTVGQTAMNAMQTSPGVNPLNVNGDRSSKVTAGEMSLGKEAKSKSEGINSGGQRSIVINIGKQIEKLEVHVLDAKEGANEIESMVREAMRRVMYSLNGVAPN